MFCISIQRFSDGYTIIDVTDCDGVVCSYLGYGHWPEHRLLAEQGIRI